MKELLFSVTKKDFIIQTFRAGGKGGQNQNKRNTGVRIIHPDSGARGESREHRTQLQNKRAAFRRLTETKQFKKWIRIQSSVIVGQLDHLEDIIADSMRPENLKFQIRKNGRWVDIPGQNVIGL